MNNNKARLDDPILFDTSTKYSETSLKTILELVFSKTCQNINITFGSTKI